MLETRNEDNIEYKDIISWIEKRSVQLWDEVISKNVKKFIEENFYKLSIEEDYIDKIALYLSIKNNPNIITELKSNWFSDNDCEQLYYLILWEKPNYITNSIDEIKTGVHGFVDLVLLWQQNLDNRNKSYYINADISSRISKLSWELRKVIENVILVIYERLAEENLSVEYWLLNYKQLFENIYYSLNDVSITSNPIKSKTDANMILADFWVDEKSLSILYFTLFWEQLEESKIVNMLKVEKLTENWAAL